MGVYANDNPQTRSLKTQLDLIQNKPFVRVALVTIQGASPTLQRDLDTANEIYQRECDAWIYPVDQITVNRPALLALNQDDCASNGHSVSDEEDELFDIGRGLGADIVGYYINSRQWRLCRMCCSSPRKARLLGRSVCKPSHLGP